MIPQRFHNDSTLAAVLRESQRTSESVPAILRASPPFITTRKLKNLTNSPYFGQVAVCVTVSHSHPAECRAMTVKQIRIRSPHEVDIFC
jgi:hypothetical protein